MDHSFEVHPVRLTFVLQYLHNLLHRFVQSIICGFSEIQGIQKQSENMNKQLKSSRSPIEPEPLCVSEKPAGVEEPQGKNGTSLEDDFEIVDFLTYLEMEKEIGPLDMSSLHQDAAGKSAPAASRSQGGAPMPRQRKRGKGTVDREQPVPVHAPRLTLVQELHSEIHKLPKEDRAYVEKLLEEQERLHAGIQDLSHPESFMNLLLEGKVVWQKWMPYMAGCTGEVSEDGSHCEATAKFADAIKLECFRLPLGDGGLLEKKGHGSCVRLEQAKRAQTRRHLTEACRDSLAQTGHPGQRLDALAQEGRYEIYRRRAALDFLHISREVLPEKSKMRDLVIEWCDREEPLRAPPREGQESMVKFVNERLARYEVADAKTRTLWDKEVTREVSALP